MLSELTRHGIRSRFGKKRADLKHQALDPIIVVGPWVIAGALPCSAGKALARRRRN